MRTIAVVLVFLLGVVGVAGADQRFHAVPAAGKGKTPLQLKVVSYDGATNGELTVEVKNTGKKPMRFTAEGLYFVPDGDPDTAPQRLGAVGPLQLATAGKPRPTLAEMVTDDDTADVDAPAPAAVRPLSIEIAAGASVKVKLDVFCIDSHRPSPSSKNTFTLGTARLPKALTQTIETRAKGAADTVGGYAQPAAKSAIQGEVWQARDANWIELDGEGAQDAAKK